MKRLRQCAAWLLVMQSVFGGFAPASAAGAGGGRAQEGGAEAERRGLRFRLSEGADEAGATGREARPAPAAAVRLSDAETAALLRRLPPPAAEAGDEQDFAVRENSLPPPRTGRTVLAAFPAAESREAPDAGASGPLRVLRQSPAGEVPLAPQLSVTFSQPMVAVTSQDEAAETVPVRLTPQAAGRWRWLGTRTLIFDPEGERLPMATEYTATVPAGTRAASGAVLGEALTWKFSTPAPQLKVRHPQGGPVRRDALIFLEFDQRVDPAAVLRALSVRAGGAPLAVRLATEEEVNADEGARHLLKSATRGRWVAVRVVDAAGATRDALPQAANVTVTVGAGTPSLEGPRVTQSAQVFNFRTYGPLRVASHRCGWQQRCTPTDPWQITFTNPLDPALFEQSQVKIEPPAPGLTTHVYGNTISIQGYKRGRTSYRVTVDGSLRDEFGQTLGAPATVSFQVGAAEPALMGAGGPLVVTDPSTRPQLPVYTVNHTSLRVSLYSVEPRDWPSYLAYLRHRHNYRAEGLATQTTPPGRLVVAKTVNVESRPDDLTETRIDLAPALNGGLGHVVAVVDSTLPVARGRGERERSVVSWVQATGIGLDAFSDSDGLVAWANSLADGRPLAGVTLELLPSGARAQTGADGTARLAHTPSKGEAGVLVARAGRDTAILPEHANFWLRESNWTKRAPADSLRWYVFDDRRMYRPGEEVSVKGWLRRVGGGARGDVGALGAGPRAVSYVLRDSRGNEVTKGQAQVNALGGFDLRLRLPPTMNLGNAPLHFTADGAQAGVGAEHQHAFQVQEFRRPEFEVSASAGPGPHFVGSHAQATVDARYFAGGGLPDAEVMWTVTAVPGHFTPPNRGDYTFGSWSPWWGSDIVSWLGGPAAYSVTQTFSGRTDGAGRHRLRVDFDSVSPPRPSAVTMSARVLDVNRQAWAGTASLLVHPADLYVGLRSPRTFVEQGQPLVVESIVTDIDGKAVAGRDVTISAVMLDWAYERGVWRQKETDPQECAVKSADGPVKCTFTPKKGGTYRVKARVRDDRERLNESELTLWVAGGRRPPQRDVAQERVELIPDRREYRAGETAEILVQAPFSPAEGVVTLRRSGLLRTERFTMQGTSHTLRVPIEEAYTPNLHVQVDLVGAAARVNDEGVADEKLPKRPAYASGALNLTVPPLARKLQVTARAREGTLKPGGETSVDVEVRDAEGRAVAGGEVAVVVVDEAVLALTGYRVEDPLNVFYAQRGPGVSDHHLRESVLLGRPADLTNVGGGGADHNRVYMSLRNIGGVAATAPARAPEAMPVNGRSYRSWADKDASYIIGNEERADEKVIQLRQNFDALAVFAPAVPTDAGGRAEVKVKLPDNLTRYRVTAVSVAGGRQFGTGESSITARMPLMVRPSAPRFLNFGDRVELPVVVQNQTDRAMEVSVGVRASNAELTDGGGRRVTVPANDRVEVRFPVAASKAGTARFQFAAVSGRESDAAEVSLPVWTPATAEAFATYGEVDASGASVVQPVAAPRDVFTQFGGLEVTTSSTQLQALTDAVLYLVSYPYECSEQLASRVIAVAALRDVLAAFKADGLPPPDELKRAVARDLKRLQGMQNDDGGFGFWRRGDDSYPYVSIHVAHALARAGEKGFDVPAEMLERSKTYLREIDRRIPQDYTREARGALVAYALNVRLRFGERDAQRARRLVAEFGAEGLPLEAAGWLLPVLSGDAGSSAEVAALRRHLNNRVEETAGAAHFTTSYGDSDYLMLRSDRRADGVILDALIADQPASDLIPKIVRGLLAHRRAGRWENTQENAFVLLALDRYFNTYERTTPDFVARAWLGQTYAGAQEFRGRSTDQRQLSVSMRRLAERPGARELVINKEGAGRLYYRVGLRYAPRSLKLDAADYGFAVARAYEAVDDPADVRRDAEGAWRIKAGARVRVRLTMSAPARRYHVALVDPLPAGLEALNPTLAVTERVPAEARAGGPQGGRWWLWWRGWFEHQNLRDERAEAFTSLLWEGVYTYTYVARATTPGAFVVPPTKAEEMYHPETFGRGPTDRVIVE